MCADSSDHRVREMYIHTLVMGLLSLNPTLHCISYFKLGHEIIRDSSTSTTYGDGSGDRRGMDYELNDGAMPLVAWEQYGEVQGRGETRRRSRQPSSTSSNSHSTLRKLADIAFGDGDVQVRLSALQQMNAMTARDVAILVTIDDEWCADMCRSAVLPASRFVPNHPSQITSPANEHAAPPIDDDDGSNELALQCVVFLRNCVVHLPSLRARVTFASSQDIDTQDNICLAFVLQAILQFHSAPYKPRVLTHAVSSPGKVTALYYALCYDMLSVWAFALSDGSSWMKAISTSQGGSVCMARVEVANSPHSDVALEVPQFVWSDFLCCDLHKSADIMTAKYIADTVPTNATLVINVKIDEESSDDWTNPLESNTIDFVAMARFV